MKTIQVSDKVYELYVAMVGELNVANRMSKELMRTFGTDAPSKVPEVFDDDFFMVFLLTLMLVMQKTGNVLIMETTLDMTCDAIAEFRNE